MKRLASFVFLFLFANIVTKACEPSIIIEGKEKPKYKKNDELVIKVRIVNTHRNCNIDIKNTKDIKCNRLERS